MPRHEKVQGLLGRQAAPPSPQAGLPELFAMSCLKKGNLSCLRSQHVFACGSILRICWHADMPQRKGPPQKYGGAMRSLSALFHMRTL